MLCIQFVRSGEFIGPTIASDFLFFFISIDSRLVVDKFQLIIDDFSLPFVINRAQETIKNNKTKIKYAIQFGWLVRLLPAARPDERTVGRTGVCVCCCYLFYYLFLFFCGWAASKQLDLFPHHHRGRTKPALCYITIHKESSSSIVSYRIVSWLTALGRILE